MKIYTRTGDQGSTGLFGGPRVRKDDIRIEAYGTIDELNAAIGMIRSNGIESNGVRSPLAASIDAELQLIQQELFSIGAELATPDPLQHQLRIVGRRQIERLEQWIDRYERDLPALKNFILPDGHLSSSIAHLARSVCRRAERRVVTLLDADSAAQSPVSGDVLIYLNRLSDLLFVLARVINHAVGREETRWERPEPNP